MAPVPANLSRWHLSFQGCPGKSEDSRPAWRLHTHNQKDTLKAFSSTCVIPLAFKMYASSLSKSKVKVFCRARIFIPQLMGFLRFSLRLWILVTVRKDDDPDKRRAQTMLAVCALLTVTNISLSVSAAYDIFKDRSSTLSKWFDLRVHYKRTRSIKAKVEDVCRWGNTFMKPKGSASGYPIQNAFIIIRTRKYHQPRRKEFRIQQSNSKN